jgi:uncharacterized protein (DUF433 family)
LCKGLKPSKPFFVVAVFILLACCAIVGLRLIFCWEVPMRQLKRITIDPQVMGGKPCIRDLRVTVGTIVGLIGAGRTTEDVLEAYPYLEREDILEALSYAAWRAEEIEVLLAS